MKLGATLAVGFVLLLPAVARAGDAPALPAREKLAVLVMGTAEKDAELADNLTEVLIASVAQQRGVEMAGRE